MCKKLILYLFVDSHTAGSSALSLHDALPISRGAARGARAAAALGRGGRGDARGGRRGGRRGEPEVRQVDGAAHHRHFGRDRKSTRLNSSHLVISYAVFCLKKKK